MLGVWRPLLQVAVMPPPHQMFIKRTEPTTNKAVVGNAVSDSGDGEAENKLLYGSYS